MSDVVSRFIKNVVPGVIHPLRIIWNQVIGFLFLVLGVWPATSAIKDILKFDGSGEKLLRIAMTSVLGIVLIGFGISSFLRAHRISQKAAARR